MFKGECSGCFLDAAGANASGADAHLLVDARHNRANTLQIGVPAAATRVVRVADNVSVVRRFAAEFTLQCHCFSSRFYLNYIGLDFLLESHKTKRFILTDPGTVRKLVRGERKKW